jgi:hypothetical protein
MSRAVWLPTPEQELLLRAALLDGDEAGAAWARWQEVNGGDEHLDMGSFRLLPLVYLNLARQGGDHPWLARLKGLYRRAWFLNQELFLQASAVVGRLEAAGIPTLLLKGAGLALAHYPAPGARPMDDVDIAVPIEHADRAIAELRAAGLRTTHEPKPDLVSLGHAETFLDHADRVLDLHWDLLRWAGSDAPIWEAAVPVDLRGVATRAPSATDQVLLVTAHGAYWNMVHPMRWVADLHVVLRSEIDWDRLERLAVERELTAPLARALGYVRERFAAPVPAEVVTALAGHRARPLRRVAHRVCALPPSSRRAAGLLAVYLDAYLTRARQRGERPSPGGFVRSLEYYLGVEDRRGLVLRIAAGLRRRAPALSPVGARALFR